MRHTIANAKNNFSDKFLPILRNIKVRKQVVIYLFFFTISFMLWIVQALNKNYISNIKLHVAFVGNYENLSIRNNKIFRRDIILEVEGNGYAIFREKIRIFSNQASIDLNNLNLIKTQNHYYYYFYTNSIKNELQLKYGQSLKILAIEPDTIAFLLTRTLEKKIPVHAQIQLNTAQGYAVKGKIEIIPDSITLTGPDFLLETIDSIELINFTKSNVKTDINESIKLKLPSQISSATKKCTIKADIAEYTDISIRVPIKPKNLPPNTEIITFPSAVNLTFSIFLEDYKYLNKEIITAQLDYHKIKAGDKFAEIDLNTNNSNVFFVRFSPHFVEYLLQEKK